MQVRNLEKAFDTEVLDKTGIILQIFASRARTREARLQVESARLQYMLPRLVGMRRNLSRQGGGSGRLSNKGTGEEKLELDRRHIGTTDTKKFENRVRASSGFTGRLYKCRQIHTDERTFRQNGAGRCR